MKKIKSKLYLVIMSLFIILLFTNCDGFMIQHINPPEEGPYYYTFPSTKKENKYFQYLKSLDFTNIKGSLAIPDNYGKLPEGYFGIQYIDDYSISMNKKLLSKNELDTIEHFFYKQLQYLYKNVIEDSIIYFEESYEMILRSENKHKTYQCNLSKDSLEKLCGFKVIKISKNEYKRIPLNRQKTLITYKNIEPSSVMKKKVMGQLNEIMSLSSAKCDRKFKIKNFQVANDSTYRFIISTKCIWKLECKFAKDMTFLDISIPEKKITEINIFTVKDITPSKEMIDDVSKQFKSFIKQNKYGCSRNFKINRFQLLSDSSYRVVFKTNCEKWECDFKKEIKPFGVSYSTVSYNQIN